MNYVDTEKLKSDIMDSVDSALQKASDSYGKIGEKASEAKEKAHKFVRENPEKSALIAAGIGAAATLIALKFLKGCRHCQKEQ